MKTGHKSLPDKNQPKKLQESNPEQANGKELPVPAVGDKTTGELTNQDETVTPTKVAVQESEPPNQVSEPKTEINGHSLPERKIELPVVEELVAVSETSQHESAPPPPAGTEASEPQAASNSTEFHQLTSEELTRTIDSLLDPVDVTVSVPDDVVPVETGSSDVTTATNVEITAEKIESLVNSEPPTVDVEPSKENESVEDPAVSVVPDLQNVEVVPPEPLIQLEKQDAFEVSAAAAPVSEEVSQVVEFVETTELQSRLPEPIAPEQREPQEIAPQESSTSIVEEFKPEAVSLPAEQQVGEDQVPEVTVIVTEESPAEETKEEAGFNVEEVPVELPEVTQTVAEPVLEQAPPQSHTDDSPSQDIQSDVQTVEIVPTSIEVPEAQESVKAENLPEEVGSGVVEDIATVSGEVSAVQETTPAEQVQTVPEQDVEQTEALREEPQEQEPRIEQTSTTVVEEEQALPQTEVESVDGSIQEVAPSEQRPTEEPVPVEQSIVSVEEPVQEDKPSEEPVPVEQSTVSVEEPVQEEKPSEEPVPVEQSTVSVEEPVQEEKPFEEPVPVEESTVLVEVPVQEQPTNLPSSEFEPEIKPAEETTQSDAPNPILENVNQEIPLPEEATLPESELPAPAEVDNGAISTDKSDAPVLEEVGEQSQQQRQTWWDSEKNAEETSVLEVVGEQGRQARQSWWSGKGDNAEEVPEGEVPVLEKVSGDVRDSHQAWWSQAATTEAGNAEASDSTTLEQVPVPEIPGEIIENVPVPDDNVPTPAINGFAEEHNDVTNADINSFPPSDLPPQEIVPNDYPAPVQEDGLPTDFPPPIQDDQISGKETLGFSPSSDLSPEPTLENNDPKSTEEPISAQA